MWSISETKGLTDGGLSNAPQVLPASGAAAAVHSSGGQFWNSQIGASTATFTGPPSDYVLQSERAWVNAGHGRYRRAVDRGTEGRVGSVHVGNDLVRANHAPSAGAAPSL